MKRLAWILLVFPLAAQAASRLDYIEHLFGASNVNAVAGHGAVTAGFSADGDLTVLAWPSPGYSDQLTYISSNDVDARSKPHLGALDGMGSYFGLVVNGGQVTWLRDAPWTHAQGYSQPDSAVVVTRFENQALGLTVTLTDVVSPDADALSRHVLVERGAGSTVTEAELLTYENLSPALSEVPEMPVADWALDFAHDFIAIWDEPSHAILHFHPGDRARFTQLIDLINLSADVDFGAAEALMKSGQPSPDALIAAFDDSYPAGVAALITSEPPPAGHQVGNDAMPLCARVGELLDNILALPTVFPGLDVPIDPQSADFLRCQDALPRLRMTHGWTWQPEDALADAADGRLSGSPVAAGPANGALSTPLAFDGDRAEATVIFAFGDTRAAARATLASVQARPFAARQAASEQASHDAVGNLPLPDAALGERVRAIALRALVNLYVARDRATGAFLASVTRQPPYYLDWPRDGAFLSVALDLGGVAPTLDWVGQRHVWYTGLIRGGFTAGNPLLTHDVPVDPDTGMMQFPRSVWEMNYYVSGAEAGPIRFEIDNTALHVWATVVHAATLAGDARHAFAEQVWPTDKQALDVLLRWRDPATGLPAKANEDDNLRLTSTLHGASAVYAGLVAGARLAHYMGDDASARKYLARSRELGDAMVKAFRDPQTGLFRRESTLNAGIGATGWLVWPARFFAAGDADMERQLGSDMDQVLSDLSPTGEGATYSAKNVVSAALYGRDGGARDQARQALARLAEIATPDTNHFGEVFLPVDGVWSNRTATPHVWEGMLFYLAAMALSQPARFNADERELPLPGDGGGCSVGGRGAAAPIGWLLLATLFAAVRWYKRRP